jgi:cation:H+ antiporter
MMVLYIALFLVSVFALVKSGAKAVQKLVAIARYLRISEYVLAFILMALATSLPEFFVGINSALAKASVLSLGNIIGSNIVNLSLILGVVVIFAKGIKIESKIAKRDAWIVFFISILPLLLLVDKNLSQADGAILLIVFIWYLRHILKDKEAFRKRMDHMVRTIEEFRQFAKNLVIFVVAIAILLISSWGVVKTATLIAEGLELPLILIGLVLVAIGTSLPELVFGIKAVITKHEGMNLGNLIGSTVMNSTLILGITALIYPIRIENFNMILTAGLFMVFIIFIVNFFIATKEKISWKEGVVLIGLYIAFLMIEFLLK